MVIKSTNKRSYNDIFSMLKDHNKWFSESIPLIASENVPSPAVREALISDFGNRYAEGWPGERVYAGCTYIDKVEFECIKLAKKLFRAEFADVRPISGVVANLAIYSGFTNPGDIMLTASIPAGGHISHGKKEHFGTAGLVHGLNIEFYPFDGASETKFCTKKFFCELYALKFNFIDIGASCIDTFSRPAFCISVSKIRYQCFSHCWTWHIFTCYKRNRLRKPFVMIL